MTFGGSEDQTRRQEAIAKEKILKQPQENRDGGWLLAKRQGAACSCFKRGGVQAVTLVDVVTPRHEVMKRHVEIMFDCS